MNISLRFIQFLFSFVSVLFSISLATTYLEGGVTAINLCVGLIGGVVLAALLIGFGNLLKQINLRTLNTAALGFFFGFLLAESILLALNGVLGIHSSDEQFAPLRFFVYLASLYMGVVLTLQATDEIHLSIPFLDFKRVGFKKKDILVDISILNDPRIIDLASTGLLDHQLIVPRFALKELYAQVESQDEMVSGKARRSLEIIKKLENIPTLDLRYVDTDFPEIKDPLAKLIRLARMMDTNMVTSDISRIQQASIEGVRIINIHVLSNALKPITQAGEAISIKVQRYGKEARQGVGYLDDGTMVVVNGGAEFIGETIKAHVLSVKHTSSGRMIFCNANEEEGSSDDQEREFVLAGHSDEASSKSFLNM